MANVVNRIQVEQLGGRQAKSFIGRPGELFFDSVVGDIRIGDGLTPGGRPTGGSAALGIYRHYQAGCNIFRNSNDQDIAQIIIHNAIGRVDYINYTPDTNNDDFYVTGLQHQDQNDQSQWNANRIVVLNVYSMAGGDLAVGDLRTFVRKFIDTVLYTNTDVAVETVAEAKDLFYKNIEILTQSLPAGALFDDFLFNDNNRMHWPEYNMIHADGTTAEPNYSANFKIYIPGGSRNKYPGWDSYDQMASIKWLSSGTGYAVGDKITVNGAQLGGNNTTNDFTLTVLALKSGNITGLTMTNAGTNFTPSNYIVDTESLSGGSGGGARIHINSCNQNGGIIDWEIRDDGGEYQVGDILTLNFGGDDATFEVTSVGINGIDGFLLDGNVYLASPAKAQYGYWPSLYIKDGRDDQYDWGNWISTDVSSSGVIAGITGNKMTIDYWTHEGSIPLQAGMVCTARDPENISQFYQFTLVSKATDNDNIWYITDNLNFTGEVRIDGINYGNGNVQQNNGSFGGGDYVTVYDQSIFAMMAFGANVNSVYYNGNMGADSSGVKDIEVLFGVSGESDASIGIPQRLIGNNDYTIVPTDAGKHIYNPNGDNNIYIPTDAQANFPVGAAITVISSNNNTTWISRDNGDITEVWGAGFNTQSNWWAIPPNSMATILKVGPNKWIVSGAGLYNDD